MAKVQIGFFSFTEITDAAEHRSYNEWHQLDHMPEQYPLAGVVFGQRWVSTPACRRAREYDDPSLAPVHYMTLYLMGEPLDETLREFRALGERLRAEGRFHQHRRSRLSGPLAVIDMQVAPRVLVSAQSVPYRPNRGIYVVVRDGTVAQRGGPVPPDSARRDVDDEDTRLADALLEEEGVAGVWTFATDRRFDDHGWHPGDRTVTVSYLDADPLTVAPRLGELVRGSAEATKRPVVFAGPFQTITPWSWDWFDGTT
ncbi:MAG: hypothetical protein ABSC30_05550 [Acidimicrobiales bacterium]|jgi:hypothetical protein